MAPHTILVVDDEPASVRAVARALADTHRVITATSGTQGLVALAEAPVALVIVDQRMPVMSGTELLAQCARQRPEIIRILLTGYTDIETLLDAINAGHVYCYVTKPWEPRELRVVVQRALERYDVEEDRRRLLGELERAIDRARREADQKGRLLALAAHELGTPLHVLSNALEFLAEGEHETRPRAWLDTAQRSAAWLGRVLAQMADAARWRTGRIHLTREPVALRALLDDLQASFRHIVSARGLELQVEVDPRCPPLAADAVWLGRAVSNLVSNAVRFTPDGGAIAIRACATASAVTITVTDTGIGIEAGLLAEVFEPFSAACGDVALHGSGTFAFGSRGIGLGLATTRTIVEAHGGTIGVTSAKNIGSQFTLTLPLE